MKKFNNKETHPNHLSQTIFNRLFGRVLQKEGTRESRHAECQIDLCISASQTDPHPSFGHPLPKVEGIKRKEFTKPSRGTNEVRGELQSTETLSFRCCSERYRLENSEQRVQAAAYSFNANCLKRGAAFTLAEVLITLGIIGIVAAITIPSLVHKYKVMVLRNQFKVADAFLQESLQRSITELGYINANEFMPQQNVSSEGIIDFQNTVEQLNEIWLKQFKIIKKFSVNELLYKKDYICHAVSDNSKLSFTNCPMIEFGDVFLLSNGILVTRMYEMHSAHGYLRIAYTFDTNGLKGPNRHGYDIFSYRSIEHIKMCNSTLPGNYSSLGCYYFASKNINPVYDDKEYWDILYKPKSYFEKK